MTAGRPTKYQESFPQLAYELALLGKTDVEVAALLSVSPDTLYEWDRVYPEFSETRRLGKEIADAKVASSLYQRAIGYEHDDVHIAVVAGEIVQTPIRKRYPPDYSSAALWLSNRQGSIWRLKSATQQLDKDGNPTDPIAPVLNVTVARE
jgi:hypothetical protein